MQRKKNVRKERPIRYVVEHVYSCTESMEGLLTVVSEEDVRKNVEEKLKNERMRMGKKDILKDKLTVDTGGGKGYNEAGACLKNHVLQGTK